MTHAAFEEANTLNGRGHSQWAAMAEAEQKNGNKALAAKYWINAAKTTLSVRRAAEYMEKAEGK